MKSAVIFALALAGLAAAEEGRPDQAAPIVSGVNGAPWLGLTVGRLDDAVRAQVPELPPGIGFVVARVEPGGPAEKAGVRPYDIFWKLGDQWIANEAQLLTLLRLRKADDGVTLGLYRSGELLSLPVVLGRPPQDRLPGHVPGKAAVQPDAPMKVLKPAERSAEIEAADGKAVLSLVHGRPEVTILSSDGATLYEGPVNDADGISLVPDPWKPRVGALERALAHAMSAARPPRTRVLPPADMDRE